ncbi:hypothetical protein TrVE_jg11960 [Triparma verrucosa]|uniref:Folate/biopterin transporter n=1 Tax=Triparma verrucosa TaxID=1606542 RepID=A0A9W7C3A3_9STRA|nr:hypothetical protein TrVE_jg11960 [Triparma verrucosa]
MPSHVSHHADERESQPLVTRGAPDKSYSHLPKHRSRGKSSQPPWTKSLYSKSNFAILASYLCVGFTASFIATPLSVYLVKELSAQPEEQNTITMLMTVPWSFKLCYGFLSDTYRLFGYRRKSYLLLGYVLYALSMSALAYIGRPNILELALFLFIGTTGIIMSDVSADTIVVERSKYEPEHKKGSAQATCYSVRFFGGILGALAGCTVYNKESWGWGLTFSQVCAVCAAMPLAILMPSVPFLYELEGETKAVKDQIHDIWDMVQLKAVWKPMTFIYCYNVLQTPNVAWNSYLQLTLKFPAWFIGFVALVGSMMTFLGIVCYKKYFFRSSWRSIYVISSVLTTLFSCMQLILIFQWNTYVGISNYPFAMGDDVLQQFLGGIQFLPSCIMYMTLCPKGSEGATYSMLTTFGNIALVVAAAVSNGLGKIWDCSNEALENHQLGGLWKLALLTSVLPLFPLVLLNLLPSSQKEQKTLQKNPERSKLGGTIFLVVLFSSLFSVIVNAVKILLAANTARAVAAGSGDMDVHYYDVHLHMGTGSAKFA